MSKLNSSKVYRGGVTAPSMSFETSKLQVEVRSGVTRVSFQMRSKGGGSSLVWVDIGANDFPTIFAKMVEADRQAAMASMAAELSRQISEQPVFDVTIAEEAMDKVCDAAQQQYAVAPAGSDHAEKFILDSVSSLIEKIRDKEKTEASEAAAA